MGFFSLRVVSKPGALLAAQHTNISLTSLDRFEKDFPAEVASTRAKVLDERIATLAQAFAAIWDRPESERTAVFARYPGPPGFDLLADTAHAAVGVTARLSQMRQALENARYNRWPVAYYPLDHVDGELFDAKSWESLLFVIESTLITCQRIYAHMSTPGANLSDWKDLQPPELTELLDRIRGGGR